MTGTDEPPYLIARGLFEVFCETASFKQRLEPGPSPPPQVEAAMRAHSDHITRLRAAVGSNSAGQVPSIDTKQQLVRKDCAAGNRAEENLRKMLGDYTYSSFCPSALKAAIVAEYVWLDVNFPDPSMIVVHLATAFERQLKENVFRRFCDALVASGARNYPELDGYLLRPPIQTTSDTRPFPGQPLPPIPAEGMVSGDRPSHQRRFDAPWLMMQGDMNPRLSLGDMGGFLKKPRPAMQRIFGNWGLNALQLARLCGEIAYERNPAVHQGGFTLEQASNLRRNWLQPQGPGSSIFASLIPSKGHSDRT